MSRKSDDPIDSVQDLYGAASGLGKAGEKDDPYAGHTRVVEGAKQIGKSLTYVDSRKFYYDVLEANRAPAVPWHVSKDDRMDAADAGKMLHKIHELYGVERESPAILKAFDSGLFFFHTINSGSVLQPMRSWVNVGGSTFYMEPAIRLLGVDIRRFFRAFADDVTRVNQSVLSEYDPSDPLAVERYHWLMEVAAARDLSRFPHLAHDSADKGSLTPVERAAVARSKVSVFQSIVNAADRYTANARTTTADDFDTTNLVTVPNKSTVKV